MLINNKKLLHHILPILLLALLGMRTARAVAPSIVIPPKALLTKQGGAYGRCPNGTRALTAAELRGSAELQTYLRQITPGWSIYGLYDGTYLGQSYGGIIKDAPPGGGFIYHETFCITTIYYTGQPDTDHYYSKVTATRLLASTNSGLCAVFARDGKPLIGACTRPYQSSYGDMYDVLRRLLYMVYMSGLAVRVHVSKEEQYYDYEDATFETYALTGISICNPAASIC
ncbi:pertussis toxin binding subunit S3 [Bordetella bronchiseptica]|uniref:Pertussis toxin subunit 3 n=1 Tax=Bordetella bronchiseptica (strain ATCC BAA-588 / NCTC 13252 / RB50) TaxID=257310 RepID=A0A0H3LRX9_BORBR|nr:pertussis toxin binding subunit S3 [Bordetella bronchiseptica]KAK63440.1 pertussis toxin subunit 3 [Bordetella bronchiseptica 980-2]KDD57845.1 pertussis toxin subunit 3 [Bordetella bronchiseptica OSU553]AMG86520.1 Pertussis toxin subunit 2 [Bordetella bronchiseptica]AWP82218.1 Pertussis toxin subunit 2 [Bordetella bronchiseptica]KCV50478.1 pertussis toxin subunit 3 [Bordetella bronchiseptica 3E44]